ALHARDCEGEGFEWLLADESRTSVYAWIRKAPEAPPVAVIANFTPVPHQGYRVPLPAAGRWREILNTDAAPYGGSGMGNLGGVLAAEDPQGIAAQVNLPPLATLWLEFDPAS
ncbi:MAG: alpha amylase C-terminal domain-containing protein, partial [Rhodobacteraceae bacterium]|nr:alpha amylase C-terminal domain-containing protein [Paracoccaceae bacterium]